MSCTLKHDKIFFYHKGKEEGTKDSKLDVDDASLCVPLCLLCGKKMSLWGYF